MAILETLLVNMLLEGLAVSASAMTTLIPMLWETVTDKQVNA